MAPRTFWKGYLKLSLVTCPVAMTPAISDADKVRFHLLNRETGNRVEMRFIDGVTGKPVKEEDEVKGYQTGEESYVMLEDEELEAVALESTRTIDVEMFAPRTSIDWVWYDRPHYLVPNDKVGEEAFAVIRDAMKATDMVGIARVVLYRRERAILLQALDKGILVWTLRYGDEVRDEDEYFERIDAPEPDADAMALVKKLIGERTRAWDPSLVKDPVQARLKKIIAAKKAKQHPAKKGAPKEAPAERPAADNVVNIMDALRKSLAAEKKAGKRR